MRTLLYIGNSIQQVAQGHWLSLRAATPPQPPSLTFQSRSLWRALEAAGGPLTALCRRGAIRRVLQQLIFEDMPTFSASAAVDLQLGCRRAVRVQSPSEPVNKMMIWRHRLSGPGAPLIAVAMNRVMTCSRTTSGPPGCNHWAELVVDQVCGNQATSVLLGVCPHKPDLVGGPSESRRFFGSLAEIPGCIYGVPQCKVSVRFRPGTRIGVYISDTGSLYLLVDRRIIGVQPSLFDPRVVNAATFFLVLDLTFDVSGVRLGDGWCCIPESHSLSENSSLSAHSASALEALARILPIVFGCRT